MLRAFRWNLRVLSYISLVVGAFLIYNTISVSVVRRRAEIGILRAIGAARSTILSLFLAEALLFGVVGAALGVLLGRILAGGAVRLIADTVNALYTTSRPAPVELTAVEAWTGILTGALVAFASALAPAREAMLVAPTEAMSRGAREHHARLRWRRGLAWSGLFAVLALAASQADPVSGYPAGRLRGGPAGHRRGSDGSARGRDRGQSRHPASWCARASRACWPARSLTASLSRTSVVVAALATAIAMMASVGIMVGSFRETVALWLDTQLRADLYVRPAGPSSAGDYPPLAPEVPGILSATAGRGRGRYLPRYAAALSRRARHPGRRRYGDRAPLRPPALPARRRPRRHSAQPAASGSRHRERTLRQQTPRARGRSRHRSDRRANRHPDHRRHLLRVLQQSGISDSGPRHAAQVPAGPAGDQCGDLSGARRRPRTRAARRATAHRGATA